MKAKDRLFILGMVLLICIAWIWGLREFAKNRNLNGINVVWEANMKAPADTITINLQLYATWATLQERQDKFEKNLEQLKGVFTWASFTSDVSVNYDRRDNPDRCYLDRWGYVEWPCYVWYQVIEMTWDTVELWKFITDSLKDYTWVSPANWILSINDNSAVMSELRAKANQNAKEKAESLAKDLWVKLGKLLMYSENGFDGNQYYYNQWRVQYYSSANPSVSDLNLTATVYHTYAIK